MVTIELLTVLLEYIYHSIPVTGHTKLLEGSLNELAGHVPVQAHPWICHCSHRSCEIVWFHEL